MSSRVIGLIGKKGSGKSTACQMIKEKISEAQELMLAGHLKNVLSKVFFLPLNLFEDQTLKEKEILPNLVLEEEVLRKIFKAFEMDLNAQVLNQHKNQQFKTTRKLMQYVGTDVLRALDPDIHIKWAMKTAKSPILIVSDIRFPNEMQFFKENSKFLSVGLVRPNDGVKDQHASEAQIEKMLAHCDVVLKNDQDLQAFQEKLKTEVLPRI